MDNKSIQKLLNTVTQNNTLEQAMKLLHVDSSINGDKSVSRKLSQPLIDDVLSQFAGNGIGTVNT